MNFFHRPKTPAVSPSLDGASRHSRPKLTTRATNDKAGKTAGKDKHSPALRENDAVQPFAYVADEEKKLYLGTWRPLQVVDTIHGRLMSNVGKELPVNFNGELCHIFEDYRRVYMENARLVAKEQTVSEMIDKLNKKHAHQQSQWQEDEADYIKEIKRLETIIAHSNYGVEGVIKARRDSVIRKKREKLKISRDGRVIEESTQGHPQSLCEVAKKVERDSRSKGAIDSKPWESLYDYTGTSKNSHEEVTKDSEGGSRPQSEKSRYCRPYSFLQGDELNFEQAKPVRRRPRSSSLSQILPLEVDLSHRHSDNSVRTRRRPSSVDSIRREQAIDITGTLFLGHEHDAGLDRGPSDTKIEFHHAAPGNLFKGASCEGNQRLPDTKCSRDSAERYATDVSPMEGLKQDPVAQSDSEISQICRRSSPATAAAAAKAAVISAGKHRARLRS